MNDYKPNQQELDAIVAISKAHEALCKAVELAKRADYGSTYVVNPLERALQETLSVLITVEGK